LEVILHHQFFGNVEYLNFCFEKYYPKTKF